MDSIVLARIPASKPSHQRVNTFPCLNCPYGLSSPDHTIYFEKITYGQSHIIFIHTCCSESSFQLYYSQSTKLSIHQTRFFPTNIIITTYNIYCYYKLHIIFLPITITCYLSHKNVSISSTVKSYSFQTKHQKKKKHKTFPKNYKEQNKQFLYGKKKEKLFPTSALT